jgi:hypothetical protein
MAKTRGYGWRWLGLALLLALLAMLAPLLFFFGLCGLGLILDPPTEERMAEIRREQEAREAREVEERQRQEAEKRAAWEALPAAERAFCDALTEHARLYHGAPNDLKRSAVRAARGKALRDAVPGGRVQKWTATIKTLTTTSEGNAVLEMVLPCDDFGIGTMNNELSDIGYETLIPITSSAFEGLSDMKPGTVIWFNGALVPDDSRLDGFVETSLTERGSMTGGYFLVKIVGS